MKKLSDFMFHSFAVTTYPQTNAAPAGRHFTILFKSYVLKTQPPVTGNFEYQLHQKKEVAIHQLYAPLNISPESLKCNQHIYNITKWQGENLIKGNFITPVKIAIDSGIAVSCSKPVLQPTTFYQPISKKITRRLQNTFARSQPSNY